MDQFHKISELKETFGSQKRWINILMARRFPLQLIPLENIVDVAKKMNLKNFVHLMKSCKWVNAVITENRSNFILHDYGPIISYDRIKENKLLLESYQYYSFDTITFRDFENHVDELLAMLNSLNGTVLVAKVHLVNTVAIKELFLYLRPTYLTVQVDSSPPHSHCPIAAITRDQIPGHLRRIDVVLDAPSTVELLESVISHFVGKSVFLSIRVSLEEMSLDILYDRLEFCMKNLAMYRWDQVVSFKWTELADHLINKNKLTIVELFQSKAECSGLTFFLDRDYPWLLSFYKTEPGLVITLLEDRVQDFTYQSANIEMSYCPTKQAVCDFASDFYSNDANNYDHDTLKSLKDKIEDHFSSNNGHDVCYEPFENIEEQEFQLHRTPPRENDNGRKKKEFQLQPKQLEVSELQLILDWKQRKPLPQLFWRLPVTEQVQQQLELLREAVDIQKQWITFLRKGKVILKEIPRNCVLEIFKKMDTKTFVKALRMSKEIKKFIDCERPTFIKYVKQKFIIIINYDMDEWVANELECRSYFRFMEIQFFWFRDETETLRAVVGRLAERNIQCDTLDLNDTTITQEMVESLRPKHIFFRETCYGGMQNYPEHVMCIDITLQDSSRLIPTVEDLAGKHFQVEIVSFWYMELEQNSQLFMQAIRCCIEKIKSRRGNGRFIFDCRNASYWTKRFNQEEISQGHDCFSYIKSAESGQTFIFVTKAAGGVVAGVFSDSLKKFLWQFITTMKDFEKLFTDGTKENDRILGPEDEIAFSTIRSHFSQ